MAVSIIELGASDAERVEAFLVGYADSSMFLRVANGTGSANYAAAVEDGRVVAVAAHAEGYGTVLIQAPVHVAEVVRACVAASGRPIKGLLGPFEQVVAARTALGLDDAPTEMDSRDILFGLDLAELVVPQALASGALRSRPAAASDLDTLIPWRIGYGQELLGERPSADNNRRAEADMTDRLEQNSLFVLTRSDGDLVSMTGFNARLPDMVQVGGVWTPPKTRSRGYARCAVAGSLLAARDDGAARAVLFTGDDNQAAQKPYKAIGFTECGDYGLVLFDMERPD